MLFWDKFYVKIFRRSQTSLHIQLQGAEYGFCGSGIGLNIVATQRPLLSTKTGIASEFVHQGIEQGLAGYLKTAAHSEQILRLAEPFVVGAEQNGDAIYRRFGHIMYAGTESTTHVCQIAVAVNAAKQTETVDDEAICLRYSSLVGFGIAHKGAFQFGLNVPQMCLINDMRCKDELHLRMVIEIGDNQFLILRP